MGDDPSRPYRRPQREALKKRATLSFGLPPVAPKPEETPGPGRVDVIEVPMEELGERRRRSFRPLSIAGLHGTLERDLGWMTDDQRESFLALVDAGELLRAHDQLVMLSERYPKNLTIKKTIAVFRAEVIRRVEEVFGGLHVVIRRTQSFPSMRSAERTRFASLIDGSTPVETILRQSKMDRLRGLEALYAWFKAGAIDVLESGSEASRTPARSDVAPRIRSDVSSWPPPVSGPPPAPSRRPPRSIVPQESSGIASRAGLRALGGGTGARASTPPATGTYPPPRRPSQTPFATPRSSASGVDLPAMRSPRVARDLEVDDGERPSQLPTPVPPRPSATPAHAYPRTGTPTPVPASLAALGGLHVAIEEKAPRRPDPRAEESLPDIQLDPPSQEEPKAPDAPPPPTEAASAGALPSTLATPGAAREEAPPKTEPAVAPLLAEVAAVDLTIEPKPPARPAPRTLVSGTTARDVSPELEQSPPTVHDPIARVPSPAPFATPAPPVRSGPNKGILLALGAALLATTAVAFVLTRDKAGGASSGSAAAEDPKPTTTASAAKTASSSVATAGGGATASVSSATTTASAGSSGKTIRLALELDPYYARVTLDGKPLPAKVKEHAVARDGKQHELVVDAVGYRKKRLKFTADADTRLVVALELIPRSASSAPAPSSSAPLYDRP